MLTLEDQILDISNIENLALKFSKRLKAGDILFLQGDLGSGKTTLARFLINNLYLLKNLPRPNSIKSPTYPILLTYNLQELYSKFSFIIVSIFRPFNSIYMRLK